MRQCFNNWKQAKEISSEKFKNLQTQFHSYIFQEDSSFFINSLKINKKEN